VAAPGLARRLALGRAGGLAARTDYRTRDRPGPDPEGARQPGVPCHFAA